MTGCGNKIGPYHCCTVVCGDCLELMKAIPDGAVDAVITDPPYGVLKAEWDVLYPKGIEAELLRLANLVAVMPGDRNIGSCIMAMGQDYKGVIAARNMNGMSRSDLGFSNWIAVVIAGEVRMGTNAFDFSIVGDMPPHPSPKPIECMLRLVDRLTDADQTILDPFLGSGTTAVAAKKLGRHFLGFEINEEYCRIVRERIALVEMQPNLFERPIRIERSLFEAI